MLIDYKFWYVKKNTAGFITEAAVKVYFGEVTTETETDSVLGTREVTRYRRQGKIAKPALDNLKYKIIFDSNNNPAVLLNMFDFGQIKTEDQLRAYVNNQLRRFTNFTPIAEQT